MFALDMDDNYLNGFVTFSYINDPPPNSLQYVDSLMIDSIILDRPYSRYYSPMSFSFTTETKVQIDQVIELTMPKLFYEFMSKIDNFECYFYNVDDKSRTSIVQKLCFINWGTIVEIIIIKTDDYWNQGALNKYILFIDRISTPSYL